MDFAIGGCKFNNKKYETANTNSIQFPFQRALLRFGFWGTDYDDLENDDGDGNYDDDDDDDDCDDDDDDDEDDDDDDNNNDMPI